MNDDRRCRYPPCSKPLPRTGEGRDYCDWRCHAAHDGQRRHEQIQKHRRYISAMPRDTRGRWEAW